jgi:uncharacterized membrane protein YesL
MSLFKRTRDSSKQSEKRIPQESATSWDIIWLSIKLLYNRLGFWIQPNILFVLSSLGVVTISGAKAALTYTVAAGLRDPGESKVIVKREFKEGFRKFFWKSLLITIIKWFIFSVIALSIFFWFQQDILSLKFIAIISIYALVLWWLSVGYLFPVLIDNPELNALQIVREAFFLGFHNPYRSFVFSLISSAFLALGIALAGPILLVIPVLRSIIMMQAYWLITKKQIPGLLEIHEYVNRSTGFNGS